MAKWGEGDPRWIVEERADATNVNNWHWTERDASHWSKDKLKELLLGLKVENDQGMCEITEMTSFIGEATANNRKAKLIFFYEWDIKLEWKGEFKDDSPYSEDVKGTIHIPNLSDENEVDDVDINVTTKTHSKETKLHRDLMVTKGAKLIRKQLQEYLDGLQREFSQGMILPKKDQPESPATAPVKSSPSAPSKPEPVTSVEGDMTNTKNMKNLNIGCKIETQKLTMKEEFKCSVQDLYETLTDPRRVQAFTRSEAILEVETGGKFSLFGGMVTGDFVSLDQNKKIVQRWRYKSWPEAHYSTVTIELSQNPDCCVLKLTQTGIPKSDYDRTKQGWRNYYWRSINSTFGFGARLF